MGCSSSDVKYNSKNTEIDSNEILDDMMKESLNKQIRKKVDISHFEKVKNLYKICEFEENVQLSDLYFFNTSYLSFFLKIGENKNLKSLYLNNVEFEGIDKN